MSKLFFYFEEMTAYVKSILFCFPLKKFNVWLYCVEA
jgi:hypothetical protein